MTSREIRAVVRLEHLIFFYCLLSLINVPKIAVIWDTPTFRLFDWYVNDITYVLRLFVPYVPLLLGFTIDVKMYYTTLAGKITNYTNRALFMVLLLMNYLTVFADYLRYNNDYEFDQLILTPKVVIILLLLGINWNLIKQKGL